MRTTRPWTTGRRTHIILIPTGDKFIKIPKAREIGVLFGSLTERTLRALSGDENAFKGFKATRGYKLPAG